MLRGIRRHVEGRRQDGLVVEGVLQRDRHGVAGILLERRRDRAICPVRLHSQGTGDVDGTAAKWLQEDRERCRVYLRVVVVVTNVDGRRGRVDRLAVLRLDTRSVGRPHPWPPAASRRWSPRAHPQPPR